MRVSLLIPIVSTVLAAGTTHADTSQFKVEKLQLPGRVLGVHAEDLNGDGKRDLTVVFAAGRPPAVQRKIAIYFDHGGDHAGAYGGQPDQVLDAPRAAAFIDFGDLDGDGKRALIYGDGRQLAAFHLEAGGARFESVARPVCKAPGLLAVPDDHDLPFFDVMRDWDGDGKWEILLPLTDGIAVYTRSGDGWARAALLRISTRADYAIRAEEYEPRLRNFSARATFVVPELLVGDYDGDGKPDLFAVLEDYLQIHKGGVGATVFSPVPVARHFLGVRNEAETVRGAHVHTTVRDLDGDGVADLVVNKIAGGLGQMRAQTGFYFGKKGGGFDPPSQMLQREGYAGALQFADLDGDGKLDLVMPHVSVGLADMARVVLTKKMLIGWEARRNLGRKFSVDPETVKDLDFPVDYSQLADIDGPYPSVAGDFNGDGKADFVAANGADQLGVWLGGGKSLIAADPKALVSVAPSRFYLVTDLTGDKLADLIVFYRSREALSGIVMVLRNTGRGW